ncbi:dihydrolipoamide dehydrogenase [Cutibacterium acnes JCM 18916]|nr:dihydrolipoamide dehydrogenase [Cutibacterium acnes JCM 18916]
MKLTERGAIEIDDFMRTNVDGIYAIGDCTAKLMLAHTAETQASSPPRQLLGHRPCPSTTT